MTAAGLTLFAVGIPWGLLRFVGDPNPWKGHGGWGSPSQAWTHIQQPLDDMMLVRMLALIAWVCWSACLLSMLGEAAWYVRHAPQLARDATARTAHRTHVRELPPHRAVAALLVGGLVIALLSLWRPSHAIAAGPIHHVAGDAKASSISQSLHVSSRAATTPRTDAQPAEPQQPAQPARSEVSLADLAPPVTYTVQHDDTLWSIAQQRLGDPLRWPEIYTLNRHALEVDGRRFTDPNLILPAWVLRLPGDASTPPPATVPAADTPPGPAAEPATPAPPTPATAAPAHPSALPAPAAATPDPTATTRPAPTRPSSNRHPAPSAVRSTSSARPVGISVGEAGFIGVTLAAGIAASVAFARAHRRRRDPDDLEPPPLGGVVRAAQNAHLWSRTAESTPPDQDDADDGTPAPEPPARKPLPAAPQAPGVITIGASQDTEISIWDVTAGNGLGLTGPGAVGVARGLAMSVLTAAERRRPQPPPAQLLIPADDFVALLPALDPAVPAAGAIIVSRDLEHALELAERHVVAHRRDVLEPDPGTDPSPDGDTLDGADIILLARPDASLHPRLSAIAAHGRDGGVAVFTLGSWPGATCRIDTDGSLIPAAGSATDTSDVRFFHLQRDHLDDLITLLRAAHGQEPPRKTTAPRDPKPSPPSHPGRRTLSTHGTRGAATSLNPAKPTPLTNVGSKVSAEAARTTVHGPQPAGPHPAEPSAHSGPHLHETAPAPPTAPPLASPVPPTRGQATAVAAPVVPDLVTRPDGPRVVTEEKAVEKHEEPAEPRRRETRAPVMLHVLGAFGISAGGVRATIGSTLKEGVREFLGLLAAHPEGVRVEEIADKLNLPADPGIANRELANLRRSARKLLTRHGPTSAEYFRRSADRYHLDPIQITSDLALFTTSLNDAQTSADPQTRRLALQHAVDAYSGPYLDGSSYPFTDELREALHRQSVDALTRLADLHIQDEQPDRALDLIDRAIAWDPTNEALYARAMRLQLHLQRPDAAHRTLAALRRALAEIDAEPDPSTLALLAPQTAPVQPRPAVRAGGRR